MMYAVYDDDGRITQANQVYDPNPDLEPLMRDLGQKWVKEDRALVSPDHWYVAQEQLALRPMMPITLSKRTIQAGGNDSAVLAGIPRKARCTVRTGSYVIHNVTMEDDELEIAIPLPCIYAVRFELWPYRDAEFAIEAVA